MTKQLKNTLYILFGIGLLGLSEITSAINAFKERETTGGDNTTNSDFIGTLDNMFTYLIGLLYFIAVVFGVYGGFQILTAGGDEEKMKKGKTTVIQAVIGMLVIFLTSIIVRWIINIATGGAFTGGA